MLGMLSDGKLIIQRLGYAALIAASFLLFLYVMNLRSRFYYNGPDYSFLFWLFGWAAAAGVGLLLLRKWALLLLCSRHRILIGNLEGPCQLIRNS
jgi:hypothetical protein